MPDLVFFFGFLCFAVGCVFRHSFPDLIRSIVKMLFIGWFWTMLFNGRFWQIYVGLFRVLLLACAWGETSYMLPLSKVMRS